MYECNTAITTAESWTSAHWTLLNPLLTQIESLKSVVASGITDHGTATISSTDQIKSLTPGAYRIYQGDTDIFPYAYGVLVITKASNYSTALFYPINISNAAAVYRKSWNTSDSTWYETEWKHDISSVDLPLSIANGGTGLTSSPSMLTNLGSTTAANILAASPRPGITGTLPVTNGGTGATSASDARTNLGLGAAAVEDTVPVNKGGTGATTAAKALANLGLGTEAQGLTFNDSISQNQIASFRFKNTNDLSDYTNHQMRFVIADSGLILWDGTDSDTIWSLSNVTGILHGGTGATSASDARANLGLGTVAVEDTVPVNKGGTGETSLAKFAMNRGTTISSISSDTALLDYDTGFYKISLSAASSYIPTRYGVLELIKADNYGVAKYTAINSSAGHYWIRAFHATNKTWYDTSWLQIL